MIAICRQCELLSLSRASYYYQSGKDDGYNLLLMKLIDEQFTRTPFYGVPKMTAWLKKQGYPVNRKRVRRLMRLMGLEAIYPKRRLSVPDSAHKKYPYLLRGLEIDHTDQVWCTDMTYIRMQKGFIYLVAVMDWYSRYILSWENLHDDGQDILYSGLGKGFGLRKTGDIQHGSGVTVHLP